MLVFIHEYRHGFMLKPMHACACRDIVPWSFATRFTDSGGSQAVVAAAESFARIISAMARVIGKVPFWHSLASKSSSFRDHSINPA